MPVPFVKATACGNDFILIEGAHAPPDMGALSRRICDRHLGVGADGVEWIFPAAAGEAADAHARLFNADGTEAELSGNGTRCVAAWLAHQRGLQAARIRAGPGVKLCTLIARSDMRFDFEMEMGQPRVDAESVLTLASGPVRGIPVSMGNPHYVVFVEDFLPGWQATAAELGRHAAFPQGTNVEFVRPRGEHAIEMRIFERGVGETRSSGTGSCAAAVAAIAAGKAASPVEVIAPGGAQVVRWQGSVFLRGPAEIICRGEFFG